MTAEFAVVLPAVLVVLGSCLGAVQVVGQQVRMTDAARSLARGDGADHAAGLVRRSVGEVGFATERRGEFVCARLSAPAVFAPFAAFGLTVAAGSCALAGGP